MLNVKQKVNYRAFGLTISSVIPFLELDKQIGELSSFDVDIQYKNLSDLYNELAKEPNSFVIRDNFVMFQFDKVGIFLIQEGNRIFVSPEMDADLDQIRLLLLGTCMGAILLQRRIIPLHGSVFELNGKAFAIVGDSGAGKSTLASVFINRGYKLLSDDVIAVEFLDNNTPYVIPSYPQQKLWESSLNEFGMSTSDYTPLFERETKYAVPIHAHFLGHPLPLGGIFELNKTEGENILIEKMSGIERLKTLYTHTYRNFMIQELGLSKWHFEQTAKIINAANMYKLHRSQTSFTAYLLADMIFDTIEGGTNHVDKNALVN